MANEIDVTSSKSLQTSYKNHKGTYITGAMSDILFGVFQDISDIQTRQSVLTTKINNLGNLKGEVLAKENEEIYTALNTDSAVLEAIILPEIDDALLLISMKAGLLTLLGSNKAEYNKFVVQKKIENIELDLSTIAESLKSATNFVNQTSKTFADDTIEKIKALQTKIKGLPDSEEIKAQKEIFDKKVKGLLGKAMVFYDTKVAFETNNARGDVTGKGGQMGTNGSFTGGHFDDLKKKYGRT